MGDIWERFLARMGLMDDMFTRTGAIRPGTSLPPAMKDAVERCAGCAAERECASWLKTAEAGSPPPSFCPNAPLIAKLRVVGEMTAN